MWGGNGLFALIECLKAGIPYSKIGIPEHENTWQITSPAGEPGRVYLQVNTLW